MSDPSTPTPTYASCRVENARYSSISLAKLAGKAVVDIHGYISREFGDPVFKVSYVILADGSRVDVEGEHDLPYLCEIPGVENEVMVAISDEMDKVN